LKAAIEFRKNLTDKSVWEYNNNLCLKVEKFMNERWNIPLSGDGH